MQNENAKAGSSAEGKKDVPIRERVDEAVRGIWRPAGTTVAVALILLFGWGVVNGKHGLSAWQQQRVEDQQLRQQIQDLQSENAHLRAHVERLKTDPNAIEHEARAQLHYAKPGEVIYTLPEQPQADSATK
ncbi:MAG: septum formation initiator family protein [Terracidiphilus sp.]